MGNSKLERYEVMLPADLKSEWIKNPPRPFSSLADFLRTVAQQYAEGDLVQADGKGLNHDELKELLGYLQQFEERMIREIKLIRSEIRSNNAIDEDRRKGNADKLKRSRVAQLKRIWLADPGITSCTTLNELAAHIEYEYDYLRNVAWDTIDRLEKEGYLEIRMNDRIRWNEEMI